MPPYYMFDSTIENEEDMTINASWLLGLPRVMRTVYGHDKPIPLQPGVEVSSKGGTVTRAADTFMDWIDKTVKVAFPNVAADWEYDSDGSEDSVGDKPIKAGPVCIKTDLGPGRVEANEEALVKRQKLHQAGFKAYPSLINGTAATQEQAWLPPPPHSPPFPPPPFSPKPRLTPPPRTSCMASSR